MITPHEVIFGWRELRAALGALIRPLPEWRIDWLRPFHGMNVDMIPTFRGREAQYALLRGLGLPPGARVGVPVFTHPVVWQTIVAAGMQPVFLDTDPVTFGVSLEDLRKKGPALDCLILVHTFGYPVDFDVVAALMEGKPVLEDCAHALGSAYRGRPLGSLGAGSFFTFLFSKPLGAGGGGCAVTGRKSLGSHVARLVLEGREEPLMRELLHTMSNLLVGTAYRKPCYWLLTRVTAGRAYRQAASQAKYPVSPSLRMSSSDRGVVALRLASGGADTQGNQQFWTGVRARLPEGWRVPPEPEWGEWNHWLMPVSAPTEESAALGVAELRRQGIGARWMYYYSPQAARSWGYKGDCPHAEALARSVFTLPAHRGLTTAEREHILRCLEMLPSRTKSYSRPQRLRAGAAKTA